MQLLCFLYLMLYLYHEDCEDAILYLLTQVGPYASAWMLVSEHEHDVLVSVIIGIDSGVPFPYVIIGLDPIIQVRQ